jgi:hypothetical protein
MSYWHKTTLAVWALVLISFADATPSSKEKNPDAEERENRSKMTANPVGTAWMFWMPLRDDKLKGSESVSRVMVQPVMSFRFHVGDEGGNLWSGLHFSRTPPPTSVMFMSEAAAVGSLMFAFTAWGIPGCLLWWDQITKMDSYGGWVSHKSSILRIMSLRDKGVTRHDRHF